MKQEYIEKLQLAKRLLAWDTSFTEEELCKNVDKGCDLLEELVKVNDLDILTELLEFFTDENEDYGGVCERLLNDIWDNYTTEQIIEALSKKFDYLVDNNITRAVQFVGYSMNLGHFNDVRRIFNTTKTQHSTKFLDQFQKWYMKDYPHEISLLREDMKKW